MDRVAAYWEAKEDQQVRCHLCPHNCLIGEGQSGKCLTRKNSSGTLRVQTYGQLRAAAIDPIEKKPLFHFRPGSQTFSIASAGCNLTCPFCQNHTLSQALLLGQERAGMGSVHTPKEVVELTIRHGCASISFTYSEPILQFEFARDIAPIAAEKNIDIIFVTNGQASQQASLEMSQFLNGANVDLKAFSASSYKEVLGGHLRATTRTIENFFRNGVWIEVTTLVIPGFNDSDSELRQIAHYLSEISPNIPWHVSRFHPAYEWTDRPLTPVSTLQRAREIGIAEGLRYVYVGNLPGDAGEKTRCPECGKIVVDRRGYRVLQVDLNHGACRACAAEIAGVGFS